MCNALRKGAYFVLALGLLITGAVRATAHEHHHQYHHHGPLHGTGSSHNPIAYHPVHGAGSTHNPIVYHPVHGSGSSHNPIVCPQPYGCYGRPH
jgi:hypothetical protein